GPWGGVARGLHSDGVGEPDPLTGKLASDELALGAAEARAFLQKRLAQLGKVYASIGLSFYFAAVLVLAELPGRHWREMFESRGWAILVANAIFLLQWLLCRRRRLSFTVLRLIHRGSITLATLMMSFTIFNAYPGEVPGLPYARTLLLVTFGL